MAASRAPISVAEFCGAISHQVAYRWRFGIGLCVSGGPDSMALAALFSKMVTSKLEMPTGKVQAFIVDHQAREGSAAEAEMVAKRLERLGLPSEILRMNWPTGIIPSRLTNFETAARTERYRLLARAAIRHGVAQLYLGHHQDDQIENLLMRLINREHSIEGTPSTALAGMRRQAPIPCCGDIYGAYEGESFTRHPEDSMVHPAHSGLHLTRPFLKFSKTRLEATCEDMGVPFLTDKTNSDPTMTRRNAIRSLLANHELPRALQKDSLVKVQDSLANKVFWHDVSTRLALWQKLIIRRFDIRSGVLVVQFPNDLDPTCENSFVSVAYVLRDLIDAVSPMSRGPTSLSTESIEHVLDSLTHSISRAGDASKGSVMTTGGVFMTVGQRILQLSRQPLRRSEHVKLTKAFVETLDTEQRETYRWTDWLFWDNRYWIRLKLQLSDMARQYTIRAFAETDLVLVKTRLRRESPEAWRAFRDLLDSLAPGKIRFTLPVVAKDGTIIAFPTLDIKIPGSNNELWNGEASSRTSWQVRFRRSPKPLRAACVRSGITSPNSKYLFEDENGAYSE